MTDTGQPSFYWYDLETSGTAPRWDRIVQFAGFRTDLDLNPIGDEFCTYVRLPDDVLPNPTATLVTGITPGIAQREGVSEWEALSHIHALFSQPKTCVVGYNSLRFDDEFIRFGFYRLLMDPYSREWRNSNSRWDIIDLVRATGALRRDGVEWPTTPEGHPAYNLELMTKANGLEHGNAHDALSDVRATVALARLIKTAQPKLFDYYLKARYKKEVRKLLEPYGARLCLHVSGMYPRERHCCAPIVSICRHPTNNNSIVVADLSQDIEGLLSLRPEELRENLFTPGAVDRPPLKEIRVNRCPFVAGIEVMTDENWSRIGFDRRDVEARARRLRQPGVAQKIARVYSQRREAVAADVDAGLYDSLPQDADRSRCLSFQQHLHEGRWLDLDYDDKRLHTLAERLKARSFAELLDADEAQRWREFVHDKLNAADVPWRTLDTYAQDIEAARSAPQAQADPARAAALLEELTNHARGLRERYGS